MIRSDDLVALLRRDLAQIQLLADLGELNPENMRQLLGSLGDLVNEVELLADALRTASAREDAELEALFSKAAPSSKASIFAGLKKRYGVLPAGHDRMRTVGPFGVIDGGRA